MALNNFVFEGHGLVALPLFDVEHCGRIIESARSIPEWEPARVSVDDDVNSPGAILPDMRAALVLDSHHCREISGDFETKVRSTICPLITKVWNVDLQQYEEMHLVRYKPGGHYVAHRDSSDSEFAGRYFTVLCYLNDDFQGGGTHFPSLNYTVKPVAGKAVIFPSQYSHAALPVTKGEKFAFLTWICGPIPVRWM